MKKMLPGALLPVLLALALILAIGAAQAHGEPKPRHGGVVVEVSELHFELVAAPTGALIYVSDHGQPTALAGMSGKLTVLHGTQKSEAAMRVVGDRLEAPGLKLAPGAKVVAALTTPTKKALTVRFTVK